MKKLLTGILITCAALSLSGCDAKPKAYKFAWYAATVHPYFGEVAKGVDQFSKDYNVPVYKRYGQDWSQDNQNENIEAMAAQGYTAFSIYPNDVTGAGALYRELSARGVRIVDYGQATRAPTAASFYVGTDLKAAAMLATEKLIATMGGKGNILNVLETTSEATLLRKQGVEEVVARYPQVRIIQEIGNMTTVEESTEKVQSALAANMGKIDGIIATGYTPTVAIAQILSENRKAGGKPIHFFGIDTDPIVLDAIRAGTIDGTIAQNPYGHGYISMLLLKDMADGYQPRPGMHAIDTGTVVVTRANVDSFDTDIHARTQQIVASLTTTYLARP